MNLNCPWIIAKLSFNFNCNLVESWDSINFIFHTHLQEKFKNHFFEIYNIHLSPTPTSTITSYLTWAWPKSAPACMIILCQFCSINQFHKIGQVDKIEYRIKLIRFKEWFNRLIEFTIVIKLQKSKNWKVLQTYALLIILHFYIY